MFLLLPYKMNFTAIYNLNSKIAHATEMSLNVLVAVGST